MKDEAKAEAFKSLGNEAFSSGNLDEAIKQYTLAIEENPDNHVYRGNRSAAYAKQLKWEEALQDAEEAVKLNSQWPRGYLRKGNAQHGLARFDEAVATYEEGLKVDPENAALKQAILDAEKARDECFCGPQDPMGMLKGLAQYFQGDVLGRMSTIPEMRPYLSDPSFVEKVRQIQANPSTGLQYIQHEGIMTYIMALLKSSTAYTQGAAAQGTSSMETDQGSPKKSSPSAERQPEKAPEPELTDDQKKVQELRTEGNALYSKRQFEEALERYNQALQIDPENVNVILNCAAVYLEQGNYDSCIQTCADAVERGRAARADYKLIARALARAGNAYLKQDKLTEAIAFYNQSLTEHRDAAVLKLLRDTEREKEKRDRDAYIDVGLSEKAKEEGNAHFKAGRFPEAIKCYAEAIKRDPSNPLLLTNRAAAYSKLTEHPSAIKDCDAALAIDPNCLKAYIRKAHAYTMTHDYPKAIEACDRGLRIDPGNAELNRMFNAASVRMRGVDKDGKNPNLDEAMQNPEVQEILNDPAMMQILQQITTNPDAARDHMRNPKVAQVINKLRTYGIVQ